ncbi:hypothetical protein BST25_07500 [Mycobacterium heidelbergense]|uniref:Uncharacterized protein n=2 Tax=Mycobacterium heidelbergense TaxID=53376 RepID=A0A1X0DRJ5_MYCHE|nr:hypothetical protein [Mycobacterium heidelbergense]ORA74957.1 hypothetical protein BST25_07500 [Mycobacterium heidelbergense]BBZ51496.1 hypothetical protein MHEI_32130 [Mycobacterium heidelbergense]
MSVAEINLTDAASGMIDLFAGVENELASLANGASAASVPASLVSGIINPAAAFNDPLAVNPIQTWISLFQNAATNGQYLGNLFLQTPFPVAQQVLANWAQYASQYVSSFQGAANSAVTWIFGNAKTLSMAPYLSLAWSDILSGQISAAMTNLYIAFWQQPLEEVALPLESILKILPAMATNLQSGLTYTTGSALSIFGLASFLGVPNAMKTAFGASAQAIYNAWVAGDPVGVLTNVADLPGATLNGLINGVASGQKITGGILSSPAIARGDGPINTTLSQILPTLVKDIVTPKAQNIMAGGSLATAFQSLANQLLNGWPSLNSITGAISNGLTQTLPSLLQGLPLLLTKAGGLVSSLGTLIINLLKLL